jgi:hypothetical protein
LSALCPPSVWSAEVTPDEQKLIKRIPAGYRVSVKDGVNEIFRGDLNGDGADDYVLIVAKTDKKNILECKNEPGLELDTNPRGVMIFFNDGGDYRLVLGPHVCLGWWDDSAEAQGAVGCAPPPRYTEFEIKRGNLYIVIGGKYTFKYRNSEFELIGYDDKNTVEEVSVNFPAKKKLVKSGGKETWSAIAVNGPILLRKLSGIDFDSVISGYVK